MKIDSTISKLTVKQILECANMFTEICKNLLKDCPQLQNDFDSINLGIFALVSMQKN